MFDSDFFADPYRTYDTLRATGPVQRVDGAMGPLPTWLITGYDQARAAFTHPGISKDTRRFQHVLTQGGTGRNINPVVAATMLATDPPDHSRLRRLVAKAFTTRTVDRLRPRTQQITDDLLDALAPAAAADLIEAFAAPLPVTVISELLGVPDHDRDDVRRWSNANFAAGDPRLRDEASHHIAAYMTQLVAAKRAHPDDGLISDLIAIRDSTDRLSEHELVSLAVLVLIAGHETTTSLIGTAVAALLTNPAQHAALRDDPALIPAAIEEFLRHDPPIAVATIRFTTEPVTIGDVTIPADQIILISPGAANRDPTRFPGPAELDLTRDTTGHLAFGHGIHHCLGAALARMETEVALTTLLTRLPALKLDTDPARLQWRHSRLIRGLQALPVRW